VDVSCTAEAAFGCCADTFFDTLESMPNAVRVTILLSSFAAFGACVSDGDVSRPGTNPPNPDGGTSSGSATDASVDSPVACVGKPFTNGSEVTGIEPGIVSGGRPFAIGGVRYLGFSTLATSSSLLRMQYGKVDGGAVESVQTFGNQGGQNTGSPTFRSIQFDGGNATVLAYARDSYPRRDLAFAFLSGAPESYGLSASPAPFLWRNGATPDVGDPYFSKTRVYFSAAPKSDASEPSEPRRIAYLPLPSEFNKDGFSSDATRLDLEGNARHHQFSPWASADDSAIYYAEGLTFESSDMYVARGTPLAPSKVNIGAGQTIVSGGWPTWLSEDECDMYYVGSRDGIRRLYYTSRR
jgi:hypothetical protein